ncbi:hypothetical protein [Bradyrhizobium sp. BRP56]|uniref:hypothetical protein n=1 Tax=Bradyrhizobium sp. BRP56 TaxID=2793819 RepID=UPI001CD7E823|nr:hypothetical protein [Bradyrhizobium sp. BRP56]
MNAAGAIRFQHCARFFAFVCKRHRRWSYLAFRLLQEIAVTRTSPRRSMLRTALALCGSIMLGDVALASQGPGDDIGTASHRTRMLMAAAVYGATGLIAAVAMIGAARRHTRN